MVGSRIVGSRIVGSRIVPSPTGTRYVPGSTNGASPAVASRPAQTESLAVNLTQQCREIISKLVLVNRKYGLEFTDVHETLMRRHPEQATLIAAIVQAAKGAIGENGTGAQQAVASS
ncbi:hypothetical protein AAVH_21378 [Aphelenchoides avenae]|nr:hypothetical protein AAVH_21378 [Aphelenchus avenae]